MVRHKRKYSEPMKFATDHTLKHDYWYGQERTGYVVCVILNSMCLLQLSAHKSSKEHRKAQS